MADIARDRAPAHRHRDLVRTFLRRSKWPTLYYADVRVKDTVTKEETTRSIPFLLPHEVVYCVRKRTLDVSKMLAVDNLDAMDEAQLRRVCDRSGVGYASILPLGLWMDGVACKWDRSQSLDLVALSFPGWGGEFTNARVPLQALEHRFMIKGGGTIDDVLAVITWSLRYAFLGTFPVQRHDGLPWTAQDTWRKKLAGSGSVRSTLVRVTGDWKMYKEIFRFPQHNERGGICWLCTATPTTFKDASANAAWRHERLDHWGSLQRIFAAGKSPCPLLSLPHFDTPLVCRIDWLHALDLGVSADWIGQFFVYLLPRLPGRNRPEKIKNLWGYIEAGYIRNPCASRLDDLTDQMLNLRGAGAPKLKAHAAECRGLVPVAREIAAHLLGDAADPRDQSVREATFELARCYDALSHTAPDPQQTLADTCKRFCALYIALDGRVEPFHIRPKLHLAQELLEMQNGTPTKSWTYRDEDFGGSMVRLFKPRGGSRHAATAGLQVLQKFVARHNVPAF